MIVAICNTKGGVGKSTIAHHVIPLVGQPKKTRIYEIDDNNVTQLPKSVIEKRTVKTDGAKDCLYDAYRSELLDEDYLNVVDCGGGNDTYKVLDELRKLEYHKTIYVVPVQRDVDQFKNAKDTIDYIKDFDKDAKIYVAFNGLPYGYTPQEYFVGFFGNEKYNIPDRMPEIEDKIAGHFFIEDSLLFYVAKELFGKTVREVELMAEESLKNLREQQVEWAKKGREYFSEKMKKADLLKDVRRFAIRTRENIPFGANGAK